MRTIYFLSIVLLSSMYLSCVDDIGNYDYISAEDLLPVSISGFSDTMVVVGDELNISPVLSNLDDESRYTHLWYAVFSFAEGFLPERDTLSHTKDLSTRIKLEPGSYNLIYLLKDEKKDVYLKKTARLTVVGIDIQDGIYILKDSNDETDFDYIQFNNWDFNDGHVQPDVLRMASGDQQLKGKAVKMAFQSDGYSHEELNPDGTTTILSNQQAFYVLSDKELKIFNGHNLRLFKNYEEAFYEVPPAYRPQNIEINVAQQDVYLLNNGKAHTISGQSMNIGKFGYEYTMNKADYQLSDGILAGLFGSLGFDRISRSFVSFTPSGSTIDPLLNEPGVTPIQNMNADLLWLIDREEENFFTKSGYALMRNTTDPDQYYLARLESFMNTNYPLTFIDTIPKKGYKMTEAEVYASKIGSFCIYFSSNNILNVYLDASGLENRESVLKEFPSDEKIACIRNISEMGENDILLVVTNNAEGWKLYCFEAIGMTPEINPDPIAVYSGNGTARYIMLRKELD